LKATFEVEKGRIERIISAISTRLSEDAKPVLEIGPKGLTGYDKTTAQSYAFVECKEAFFTTPPDAETKQMTSGNVIFSVKETGTNMFKVYIEESTPKGVERNVFHDNLVIPEGDEIGFPKEVDRFSDGVLEIKMNSPRVCVADIEAIKLQELSTTDVERYSTTWYPNEEKVDFVIRTETGATVEKTFSVKYLMKPESEFTIDFESKAFSKLAGNMLGKARLSIHKRETGEPTGVVLTQSSNDYDIGYTLAALNPI
jgi:hypothetical protein